MKEESPNNNSRRTFLKAAATAISTTAVAPGMSFSAFSKPPDIDLETYKPRFFSSAEWAFILAATDRLIPADDHGPGALETNVPVFIDMQMLGDFGKAADWYMQPPFLPAKPEMGYQSPLTPAQTYRKGIKATEEYCNETYNNSFSDLSNDEKDAVLGQLQAEEIEFSELSSAQFFSFLLQNTKEGFFADPIHGGNKNLASWKMIGFPGARASYKEWVDLQGVEYPLGPVSIEGERG